jgi:hypothetical protein
METKPLIVLACLTVALILFIAGTATGVTTKSYGGGYKYTGTLWSTCVTGPNGYRQCVDPIVGTCEASAAAIRAARAFDILTIIVVGVCALLVSLMMFVPAVASNVAAARVPWGLAGGAAGAVFSLIAWAITISMYTEKQCGSSMSLSKSKLVDVGPNVPLFIVGCFLCIVAAVVSFLNGGAAKPLDVV